MAWRRPDLSISRLLYVLRDELQAALCRCIKDRVTRRDYGPLSDPRSGRRVSAQDEMSESPTRCPSCIHLSGLARSSPTLRLDQTMTSLPSSSIPSPLLTRVLPLLLAQLKTTDAPANLVILNRVLEAVSRLAPSADSTFIPPLAPLQILLNASKLSPQACTPGALLAAIIAYPSYRQAINIILSNTLGQPGTLEQFRGEILPSLVTRLQLTKSLKERTDAIHILLLLVRAHDELLGLVLEEASFVLPSIRGAYASFSDPSNKSATEINGVTHMEDADGLQGKAEALMLCQTLITALQRQSGSGESGEALKRLMRGKEEGSSKRVLLGQTLRADYEAVFESGAKLDDELVVSLEGMRDRLASNDPVRVHPITPPRSSMSSS